MSNESALYPALSRLRGQFIRLVQPVFGRYLEGKLFALNPLTATLEIYDDVGKPDGFVVVLLSTVTEVEYGDSEMDEFQRLALSYRTAKNSVEEVFSGKN